MCTKSSGAVFGDDDYLQLDSLSLSFRRGGSPEHETHTLCFWLYLLKSSLPGIIIRQGTKGQLDDVRAVPFLTLDTDRKLALHGLHPEGDDAEISNDMDVLLAEKPCNIEKWVHVGCEIGSDIARLHIDGVIVGEKRLPLPAFGESETGEKEEVLLRGGSGLSAGSPVQAFAYLVRMLPQPTVTNHYVKNPPLELLLEGTSGATDDHEVEEGGDGSWSVVGGKASCRRNFALDVALLDALGRSIHKEMELVASLVYSDSNLPVEKPKDDAEAPLLTTFDGVEFPSTERPIKLVHGRASFKLKISQLSSKCDNRLFRVCFDSPSTPKYPFLRAFSRPIRCVSRNRNHRAPAAPYKRPHSAAFPQEGAISPNAEETITTEVDSICNGSSAAPSANGPYHKRNRTGVEKPAVPVLINSRGGAIHSPTLDTRTNGYAVSGDGRSQWLIHPAATLATAPLKLPSAYSGNSGGTPRLDVPGVAADYGTKHEVHREGRHKFTGRVESPLSRNPSSPLSDFLVFKYCLENIQGRTAFLKLFIVNHGDQELAELAARVSHCTGCRHDGYQIMISKSLILEANEVWSEATRKSLPPLWTQVISCVEERFTKISSVQRMLSIKDKEFLNRVAGCGDFVTREQFDSLWSWIYPIALTLRSSQVRAIWDNEEPKWIEGMIYKEEVEALLLRSSESMAKPGTFLLRFACSRFWPHPDAGALVVSYVGHDLRINHKLLSLDEGSGFNPGERPLPEQLLSQPELKQLCKVPSTLSNGTNA
ncbi:protein MpSTAT [Marchantia polymorpha subsp. ruderalis]|uniref:SH2 domain-containing protein n=2 Tax=Marchantia polymorpha TaxID=3197 RepID=A0AAF6B8Y9_MARPO|nr:hypothetical protein MARPO_0011s0171 [Marchantia polymorpha]BBN08473.1 hypothetical protein Mp_4g11860 [Marchantia polymorpha subsp. ruderalis]|eukprot:PTQ46510.1 hypothetical protein MARPO_0011s0171 [Marchantia polymorpha]